MSELLPEIYARVIELIVGAMPALDSAVLQPESDLYDQGLDSAAAISLMLAIEESFSVTFPDYLLDDATFRTPQALGRVVQSLLS